MSPPKKSAAERAREKWAEQQTRVDAQHTLHLRPPTPTDQPPQTGSTQLALPGMAPPPGPQTRPRPACHHCDSRTKPVRDRLCESCRDAGADPVWIPCTIPGHDHVRRRRYRGEQAFRCTQAP